MMEEIKYIGCVLKYPPHITTTSVGNTKNSTKTMEDYCLIDNFKITCLKLPIESPSL